MRHPIVHLIAGKKTRPGALNTGEYEEARVVLFTGERLSGDMQYLAMS